MAKHIIKQGAYCTVALCAIIAMLLVVVALQFMTAQRQKIREAELVKKYRPVMQRVCNDLGIKIQIDDFADLLEAYERITTKSSSSDQLDN